MGSEASEVQPSFPFFSPCVPAVPGRFSLLPLRHSVPSFSSTLKPIRRRSAPTSCRADHVYLFDDLLLTGLVRPIPELTRAIRQRFTIMFRYVA
jgi:hypothetical protein